MSSEIKSETDQFWDWLFEESRHVYHFNSGTDLENWLRKVLDIWAKLPVHKCGYRATKTVPVQKGCGWALEEKIVCAHCGELRKTIDRRQELRDALKRLRNQVKELEGVLEE